MAVWGSGRCMGWSKLNRGQEGSTGTNYGEEILEDGELVPD